MSTTKSPGFGRSPGSTFPRPRDPWVRLILACLLGLVLGIPGARAQAIDLSFDPKFVDWQSEFDFPDGADGRAADPDHDGISNLAEFAYGSDPLHVESEASPRWTTTTVAGIRYPALVFQRNPYATDAFVRPRVSSTTRFDDDLGGVEAEVTRLASGAERVVFRSTRSLDSQASQFLRLDVMEGAPPDGTTTPDSDGHVTFSPRPDLDLSALPPPVQSDYVAMAMRVQADASGRLGGDGRSVLDVLLGAGADTTAGSDVGVLLGSAGKGSAALYALASAAIADPQDSITASNFAAGLNQSGQLTNGWVAVRWAERLQPTNALIQANKGWLAFNQGDYRTAETAFTLANRQDHGLIAAHDGLGMALMARGRPAEALSEARASLDLGFSGCAAALFENATEALKTQGANSGEDDDLPGSRDALRAAGGGAVAPLPELGIPSWSGDPGEIADRSLELSKWFNDYQEFLAREQSRIGAEVLEAARNRPLQRPWVAYTTTEGDVTTHWRGYDRDLFMVSKLGERMVRRAGEAFGHYANEAVATLQELTTHLADMQKGAAEEAETIRNTVPSDQQPAALEASRIQWLRKQRTEIRRLHPVFTAATQAYWGKLGNLIIEFAEFSAPSIEDIADDNANHYANIARTQSILIVEAMRISGIPGDWAAQVRLGWRPGETLPNQDTYQPTINLGKPVLKVWPVDPRKSVLPTINVNFVIGSLEADSDKLKLEFNLGKIGVAGGEVKFADDWAKNQWTVYGGLKADMKFGPLGGVISDRVGSAKILMAATFVDGSLSDYGLQSSVESRIDIGIGKLGGPDGIDTGVRGGIKAEGRWTAAAGPDVKVSSGAKFTFK